MYYELSSLFTAITTVIDITITSSITTIENERFSKLFSFVAAQVRLVTL